jgi:putative ABC transport system permease protein
MSQEKTPTYPGRINWDILVSPRWHKVLNDFSANKARIVLTILSVLVGIFALGAVLSTRIILLRNVESQFQLSRQSSASLTLRNFDDGLVEHVQEYPEVEQAYASRVFNARIYAPPEPGSGRSQGEWIPLRIIALEDYNDIRLDLIEPQSGAWPPPEKGILLERSSLALANGQVGGQVIVELPSGLTREMQLAGTVHDFAAMPGEITAFAVGYVDLDTLDWLEQPRRFNTLAVVVRGEKQNKTQVVATLDQISQRLEQDGYPVVSTNVPLYPGRPRLETNAKTITTILLIVGILLVIISGIMVANTMEAILSREVRQIGIMKVIGGQLTQIMMIYLVFVMLISAISLAVAAPASVGTARFWVRFIGSMLNLDVPDLAAPRSTFVIQAAVAFLVVLGASLKSIISATMLITAREAISQNSLAVQKMGLLEKALGRIRGVARPLILAVRNIFRNKWRLGLTMITLVMGGAVFIGIEHLYNSMMFTLNTLNQEFSRFDVDVNFGQPYRVEQVRPLAEHTEGVTYVEGWSEAQAVRVRPDGSDSETMQFIAPPNNSPLIQPSVLEGRWLRPEDENAVVINKYVTDREPDIHVGDEVTMRINGQETTWKVVGKVRSSVNFGQTPTLYANQEYFSRATNTTGYVNSLQILTQSSSGSFQRETADRLEAGFQQHGIELKKVETGENSIEVFYKRINILGSILSTLSLILGIVGGINLTGTMSVNVMERTREIGVMRAVGASSADLLQITLSEGVFIGWLSCLLAIPFSIPFGKALCIQMGNAFVNFPFIFSFSTKGVFLWLAVVTIIAIAASIAPAQNAMRITIREAISYE